MNTEGHNVKLIALDLDGTLLRSDKTISDRTKEAVHRAQAQGVVVAIATGRMYGTAKPCADQLGLADIPMVLFSGSLIQTVASGRKLFEQAISRETATALLDLAKTKGWQMQTYIDDVLQVAVYDHWIAEYEQVTKAKAVVCGDGFYTPQGVCNKILSRGTHEDLLQRRQEIEAAFPGVFTILFSEPTYLEIMPAGVNKGEGLRQLSRIFGVPMEQTMAVGDSQNDLDMLKAAGIAVAMGNADREIQGAADYVTASNDDDGVAAAIDRFI